MTRFISDPEIHSGDLCIEGTRITVLSIWCYDTQGYTMEKIQADFPDLTSKQIEDAIDFCAELRAELL